jgi:hypothetical protein
MKTAYKVVKTINRKLQSCTAYRMPGITVTYRKGHWSKPELQGSKLFAFSSLRSAREFAGEGLYGGCSIWRCGAEGVSKGTVRTSVSRENISNLWHGGDGFRYPCHNGTIFCDAIKLIKKIQ